MNLYEVLLLAHVLGVVVWVGGSFVTLINWRRVLRSGDAYQIAIQAGAGRWFELRVALPAAAIVLLAGGWLMTEGGWGMDQGWLHIGMGAVFGAVGLSIVFTARLLRRVTENGGDMVAAGRAGLAMLGSLAITLIALWSMVVKPFS